MELTREEMDDVYANDSAHVQGFGNAHKYGMGKNVCKQQDMRQNIDKNSDEYAIM